MTGLERRAQKGSGTRSCSLGLQSRDGTQLYLSPHPTLPLTSFHSRSPSSKRATGCHTEPAKLTTMRRQRDPATQGHRNHTRVPGSAVKGHQRGTLVLSAPLPLLPVAEVLASRHIGESQGSCKPAVDAPAPLRSPELGGDRAPASGTLPAGRVEPTRKF